MTPHFNMKQEDVSNIVIMPGDPLRAKYIAETYLEDYKLINNVRNNLGYTGYYKGKRISVISSGIGIPSMGIYSYELFKYYNVDYIIRVGSCGSYVKHINVRDVIIVNESYTDSNYGRAKCNYKKQNIHSELSDLLYETSKTLNIKSYLGKIYTSDVLYKKNDNFKKIQKKHNVLAVEMESFALFLNAIELNKKAGAILTVSDSFYNKEKATIEEREKDFNQMIEIALESILRL